MSEKTTDRNRAVRRQSRARMLWGAALWCCACMGWAQDSTAVDSLREVTVYARANQRGDMVPTQRLAGQRLQALSSLSVADAVRYFSGVQLKDYGGVGGLKTVDIRSMGSNHMGVFYDGIQLGNAQNGQIDLGRFSMDNIKEIALYNGQKSDLLQPARDYGCSGTVYITTRRPQFREGKNHNLRVSYKAGSFGLHQPSLLWEQRLGRRVSASLNAEYLRATGRYKFRYRRVTADGTVAWDTTAVRQNGDIEARRAEAALHGTLRRGEGRWMVKGYWYNSERGIPGAIVNNVWKHHQRQWDKNAFAQGSLQQRVSPRYEYMVKWKYAHDRMRYLNPDPTLMYIDNRFTQQEAYLSTAHHATPLKGWDLNLSADWQWNTLQANLVNFARPRRSTVMWVASTAYQWKRLRAMGHVMGTHVMEHAETGAKPENRNRLTPALFLSYRHNRALSLRAFYKRMFRMPTFNDLYYTDIGNISLKPEYATQYDVGALYSKSYMHPWLRSIELKGDAYINLIDNKIVAIPKGSGQYRWMMMNIGRVRILGSEVSAQTVVQPHPRWVVNVQASYTWQRAEDLSDPTDDTPPAGTYGGQIAYIPRHSASATANVAYRRWSLNYTFIYVGERYHNSSNIPANYEQPWYTSDLSLSRRLDLGKVKLTAALEVNNLLNQQYDVVLNYPMPGRNWKVTLKCEL